MSYAAHIRLVTVDEYHDYLEYQYRDEYDQYVTETIFRKEQPIRFMEYCQEQEGDK